MPQDNKTLSFLQAASEGYVDAFSKLLEQSQGSLLSSIDEVKNNCIHLAAGKGHNNIIEAIQTYIETHGKESIAIDVNALNAEGKTPLDISNQESAAAVKKLAKSLSQPALTHDALREMHIMTQSLFGGAVSLSSFGSKASSQKSQKSKKELPAFNYEG